MEWNYLSIPKLQRCNRWSLGMDMSFHSTLCWQCDYLSMLGLKLIYASKRGRCCVTDVLCKYVHRVTPNAISTTFWAALYQPLTTLTLNVLIKLYLFLLIQRWWGCSIHIYLNVHVLIIDWLKIANYKLHVADYFDIFYTFWWSNHAFLNKMCYPCIWPNQGSFEKNVSTSMTAHVWQRI